MSAPSRARLRDGDNPGGGEIASILVTAGPTLEYLDDVRYFANGSTGRMGYALAAAGIDAGHDVVLVAGPTALAAPRGADVRPVTSALEMQAAVEAALRESAAAGQGIDLIVAVAAVADYRPAARHAGKLPSGRDGFTVEMVRNPDILGELGARRARGELDAVLVGFALQSGTREETLALGREKLHRKRLDMIVVNHVSAMGDAASEVTLVFADGRTRHLPRQDKADLARHVLGAALALLPPARPGNRGDALCGDGTDRRHDGRGGEREGGGEDELKGGGGDEREGGGEDERHGGREDHGEGGPAE